MFYSKSTNDLTSANNFAQSKLSRNLIMIWLIGMLLLSPVKLFTFRFNMEIMDFWILMAMPLFLLLYVTNRQIVVSWVYTPVMLIILVCSFASTFVAPSPSSSFIVIAKEIYVFIWFITVTMLLCGLNRHDVRRILIVWNRVVFLHSLLIVAQFFSPELWKFFVSFTRDVGNVGNYRCPGLFTNANAAAFFQVMGFVPLVLAKESRLVSLVLGILLFISILCTGSMGALLALFSGGITAVFAIVLLSKNQAAVSKYFVTSLFAIMFLTGLFSFVISQDEDYQNHLNNIIIERAERSSGGRFYLWQRGMDAITDYGHVFWGIGPENFREVDGREKQLHNDFIAFSVERGLMSTIALVLFGVIAVSRAIHYFKIASERVRLKAAIFIAAISAILVESLTHQIFHTRELWLVLALQEAMIFHTKFNRY